MENRKMGVKKEKNKNWLILFIFLSFLFSFLPSFHFLHAEIKDYTLLAPIPLDGKLTEKLTGADIFETYIPGIFTTIIGLVAVLAVARIIWGGILYISSDAIQGKSEGKKFIVESIWGLVLISTAWLILYTINPKLVDVNLSITSTPISSSATSGGGDPRFTDETAARTYLINTAGIQVNAGPCTGGATTGCTNLVGLSTAGVDGLVALSNACKGSSTYYCNITISGGTEGGHDTHGVGAGNVDLRFSSNLDSYLLSNKIGEPRQTTLGPVYTVNINGKPTEVLKESDHWHVYFK